jgi:phage terminase large subunit-like protein
MLDRTQDQDVIDGNAIYKHTKKMHSEAEYRKRYARLDYMKLTAKQQEVFEDTHKFLSVRAGNRAGKSEVAVIYDTCALLGRWPNEHRGYKFVPPQIARSVSFNSWMIGPTGVNVRDVQQAKLLGGLTQSELGTGWLPLSALRHPIALSRGVAGLADRVLVTRDDDTLAALTFKTHEMSREAFQGDAVDLVVLDEDPGKRGGEIWPELTARIIGTGGRIIHTATPLAGLSPIRKFFREPGHPERGEIRMSIYDNTFLTAEDIAVAESSYTERERATRLYGEDLPGHGAVFSFDERTYLHDLQPSQVPIHWRWINAMDFSHGGMSSQAHPWAFVSCAYDPTSDTLYVMHCLRIKQQLPPVHVAAMKKWGAWDAPCAWPADGHQRGNDSGDTFSGLYKNLGVPMRSTHATLPTGGVSIEAALALMEGRFATGRLKIARHLVELRDELRELHYDDDNKYVAEEDDAASALRYAVMDARFAKTMGEIEARLQPSSRVNGLDAGAAEKYFGIDA